MKNGALPGSVDCRAGCLIYGCACLGGAHGGSENQSRAGEREFAAYRSLTPGARQIHPRRPVLVSVSSRASQAALPERDTHHPVPPTAMHATMRDFDAVPSAFRSDTNRSETVGAHHAGSRAVHGAHPSVKGPSSGMLCAAAPTRPRRGHRLRAIAPSADTGSALGARPARSRAAYGASSAQARERLRATYARSWSVFLSLFVIAG
ncbi:hypothetical protein FB451DRAFT_1412282 [Mycena latifolia]|nr:hypothetical protein FB451DRAFT_1412282 [Mycena latifolia]